MKFRGKMFILECDSQPKGRMVANCPHFFENVAETGPLTSWDGCWHYNEPFMACNYGLSSPVLKILYILLNGICLALFI